MIKLSDLFEQVATGHDEFPRRRLVTSPAPIQALLRETFQRANVEGIAGVKFLAKNQRKGRSPAKVYVILRTHDLRRDRRIIELMGQFDELDYDLVPALAAPMIPECAVSIV